MSSYNIEKNWWKSEIALFRKTKTSKSRLVSISNSTRFLEKWSNKIYHYLVETPGVFTRESMKNRKSLEAHNQFISGWIRTMYHYQKTRSNFVILKAVVMPSQRLIEDPRVPWIAVNSLSTMIETAHCSCMAGLGESCSHIGAILFKIEAAVRAGYTKKHAQIKLGNGIRIL